MKTQHRAIIAIVISVAFFFVYYTYINPKKDVPPQEQTAVERTTEASADTTAVATAATDDTTTAKADVAQTDEPVRTATISNDVIEMVATSDGGVIASWKIKAYGQTTEKDSPRIDLATTNPDLPGTLALFFENSTTELPKRLRYELVGTTDDSVAFSWRGEGLEIVKTISVTPGSYVADVVTEVKNNSGKTFSAKPTLVVSAINEKREKGGILGFLKSRQIDIRKPVYYLDGSADRGDADKKETVTLPGIVDWSGIESRYFVSAVIPRIQGEGLAAQYGMEQVSDANVANGLWAGVVEPKMVVASGDTGKAAFKAYMGPKDIERLKALGVNLDKAIDYGWFTVIAVPILYVLKFFYGIVHNYGVAIILLTIMIKLMLHPINVKSLKSMKAMQQLQPRLKELQKKYKDDKQKLNQETMQLFRAHKVNPMGGCLPMILQLPIYIALYKVLWNSIEVFHAPFFWFYKDLSAPDPYMITPILLGIFMVLQQLVMPSASADPAQKKMMMLMPIMFTVFMVFLPVGLVLYILVNTVMSVTQQYMYNKGIGIMDVIRGKAKFRTTAKAL